MQLSSYFQDKNRTGPSISYGDDRNVLVWESFTFWSMTFRWKYTIQKKLLHTECWPFFSKLIFEGYFYVTLELWLQSLHSFHYRLSSTVHTISVNQPIMSQRKAALHFYDTLWCKALYIKVKPICKAVFFLIRICWFTLIT